MRPQDLEQLEICLKKWKTSEWSPKTAIICSANSEEIQLLEKVYPGVWITSMDVNRWNLDDVCPEKSDLVIASNVFMCARDPHLWFTNALKNTKWLIVMDHCIAYRGGSEGEVSVSTGDVMRYTCPPKMVAKFPGAYNLHEEPLKNLHVYQIPSGCGVAGYEMTTMFIGLFCGNIEQ